MLTLFINQLFATPSQLSHKSPKKEINTLLLQVNFVYPSTFYDCRLTFLATQLLSGIIEEKASQKKQIDFLLFQVNLTYQSTFCNSKSNFCCSIKFICESTFYNYKSTFPEVTRKEINFLLLQINFCSNSKPSKKGSWLYLQSTFCDSKSTLPQLTKIEINSLLLQVNFYSKSTFEWNYEGEILSKKGSWLSDILGWLCWSINFCNFKSTFSQVTKMEITFLLL